ncbi:hypothetical protein ILUMI_16007 [Ignelater luminosus]|uniref:Uncharacterized protein n=1 Tax=Ignelater luminosus TaxID=2038154 RepID=A0A8K0CR51_IGNLU|nr:hypothetical protein ILUMI_16007 [Ignelater luminosus]
MKGEGYLGFRHPKAGLCSRQDTQKKTVLEHQTRRDRSYLYNLRKGDKHLQVCKWISEENHSSPSSTRRSSRSIESEDLKFVREFLRDLPKLPSHYCRHDTKKEYLEDNFVTYADLYKNYNTDLVYDSIRPGNKKNDPTVTDLRALFYRNGELHYKLKFDEEFLSIPRPPRHKPRAIDDFPNLFKSRLFICEKKIQAFAGIEKLSRCKLLGFLRQLAIHKILGSYNV